MWRLWSEQRLDSGSDGPWPHRSDLEGGHRTQDTFGSEEEEAAAHRSGCLSVVFMMIFMYSIFSVAPLWVIVFTLFTTLMCYMFISVKTLQAQEALQEHERLQLGNVRVRSSRRNGGQPITQELSTTSQSLLSMLRSGRVLVLPHGARTGGPAAGGAGGEGGAGAAAGAGERGAEGAVSTAGNVSSAAELEALIMAMLSHQISSARGGRAGAASAVVPIDDVDMATLPTHVYSKPPASRLNANATPASTSNKSAAGRKEEEAGKGQGEGPQGSSQARAQASSRDGEEAEEEEVVEEEEEEEEERGKEGERREKRPLLSEDGGAGNVSNSSKGGGFQKFGVGKSLPLPHPAKKGGVGGATSPPPTIASSSVSLEEDLEPEGRRSSGGGSPGCSICLEGVEEGDVVVTLPCMHQFHAPCVQPWLRQQGKVNAQCPLCKTPVFR